MRGRFGASQQLGVCLRGLCVVCRGWVGHLWLLGGVAFGACEETGVSGLGGGGGRSGNEAWKCFGICRYLMLSKNRKTLKK